MTSIQECENDIRRYNALKSDIGTVISRLSSAASSTDDLSNSIKNRYQVDDGHTPIVTRINHLNKNVDSTCNYLSNKILPAIDRAIADLNREIARLQQEEYERRLREDLSRRWFW